MTGRRVMQYPEYLRMLYAEHIVNAYASRQQSQNWKEWTESHPRDAELLAEAEKLCQDQE